MKLINRLQVLTKRILSSKLYIAMMAAIIFLSILYASLPTRTKSPDIRVGIYAVDEYFADQLINSLYASGTIYTFYKADNQEILREDVEAGRAECGFYIPNGFFTDYVYGAVDTEPMILYNTSATTLGNAISESVFSHIFKLCAADILFIAYDDYTQNSELISRLDYYINSDQIFQIEDHSNKRIVESGVDVPINIPVYQASFLLIIFSGLLGLLMYLKDAEKNYYIALNHTEVCSIKLCNILGALLPILAVSIVCCIITYRNMRHIPMLVLGTLGVIIFDFFPGMLFKKSSSLVKLLPIIMLVLIPLVIIL